MEQEGIKFKLIANSLEKAFVHLGEEKAQIDNISQIPSSTYSKQYKYSSAGMIRLLLYRRFMILWTDKKTFLEISYVAILPTLLVLCLYPNFSIGVPEIGIFMALLAFIGQSINVRMYTETPYLERVTRRRYMLKLIGANSLFYYLCLLSFDTFVMILMVIYSLVIGAIFNYNKFSQNLFTLEIMN